MKVDTTGPAYVIGYAAAISALFTGAIMALHVATQPVVERNQRLLRQRALVRLFQLDQGLRGGPTDEQIGRIVREQISDDPGRRITDPRSGHELRLIEARRQDGGLIGYAFPIWGVGFWARIDGLLAVDPTCSRALGVVFLKHSETPGLGGRISEQQWTGQFGNLSVTPPASGGQYIYIGGPAPTADDDPRAGRHVDAITGATGTSKAVEELINRRLAEFRRAAVEAGLIRAGPPDAAAGSHALIPARGEMGMLAPSASLQVRARHPSRDR